MNCAFFPVPLSVVERADGTQYHFQTLTDFVFLRRLHLWIPSTPIPYPDFPRIPDDAVIVPRGFLTDFASVPGILRGILDHDNLVAPAALIHDFLYSSGIVSRAQADEIFRAALICNGVSKPVAWAYWVGVRAGGWTKYGQRPDEASDLLVSMDEAMSRAGWR